ncbi:MAG: tetratricopeptide repeat protein, partial [Actinobacteria bacterium]|nr:tetratricopeptide repeat protein [Actinomycetota bacterium]
KDWSFHANRANTYLKEGKFTEAISDYTKAIESYNEPVTVSFHRTIQQLWYLRGTSYYYRELSTHSKDDFEHAIMEIRATRVFIQRLNGTVGPYEETYSERWANATLMCGDTPAWK